jgi:hypothetical protein
MFTGALIGAVLVIHVDLVLPLAAAAVLLAATAFASQRLSRPDSEWTQTPAAP